MFSAAASTAIASAHYDIVGENLIWAIQEVTGLENNDPIIQTWIKAYGAIADAFIGLEKDIYKQMAWEGFLKSMRFDVTVNDLISSVSSVIFVTSNGLKPSHAI
jgi:nitric oxide dioxygenase